MDNDGNFTEVVCNEFLKPRFYDPNFLDEDDTKKGTTITDYVTSCCHKDVQKRKFILRFEPDYGKACDKSEQQSADRSRCKNFWKLVDEEPLFGTLIQDGTFLYSNKPNELFDDCCAMTKSDKKMEAEAAAVASGGKPPCKDPYINKIRQNIAKDKEMLDKQRAKTKNLQLKCGQKVMVGKGRRDGKGSTEEYIFSDMANEDWDTELNDLNAYSFETFFSGSSSSYRNKQVTKQRKDDPYSIKKKLQEGEPNATNASNEILRNATDTNTSPFAAEPNLKFQNQNETESEYYDE